MFCYLVLCVLLSVSTCFIIWYNVFCYLVTHVLLSGSKSSRWIGYISQIRFICIQKRKNTDSADFTDVGKWKSSKSDEFGFGEEWIGMVVIVQKKRVILLEWLLILRSGATRNRTGDTRAFTAALSPLLYHLSYGTMLFLNCECKGTNNFPTLQTFPQLFCL